MRFGLNEIAGMAKCWTGLVTREFAERVGKKAAQGGGFVAVRMGISTEDVVMTAGVVPGDAVQLRSSPVYPAVLPAACAIPGGVDGMALRADQVRSVILAMYQATCRGTPIYDFETEVGIGDGAGKRESVAALVCKVNMVAMARAQTLQCAPVLVLRVPHVGEPTVTKYMDRDAYLASARSEAGASNNDGVIYERVTLREVRARLGDDSFMPNGGDVLGEMSDEMVLYRADYVFPRRSGEYTVSAIDEAAAYVAYDFRDLSFGEVATQETVSDLLEVLEGEGAPWVGMCGARRAAAVLRSEAHAQGWIENGVEHGAGEVDRATGLAL